MAIDRRSPTVRFFDDISDLLCLSRVASDSIDEALSISRAVEISEDGETITLMFQSDGLENLTFLASEIVKRVASLVQRSEALFPDDDS